MAAEEAEQVPEMGNGGGDRRPCRLGVCLSQHPYCGHLVAQPNRCWRLRAHHEHGLGPAGRQLGHRGAASGRP